MADLLIGIFFFFVIRSIRSGGRFGAGRDSAPPEGRNPRQVGRGRSTSTTTTATTTTTTAAAAAAATDSVAVASAAAATGDAATVAVPGEPSTNQQPCRGLVSLSIC